MGRARIHRAASKDGTEIVGRVEGQGPPLVLVHGSLEDGDLCWGAMLAHLRPHFTCYLPSTRSRGLSGASDDLAQERRVEDIIAVAESLGGPVRLFGESDGGTLALGAAAHSDVVAAVGVYEPVVLEVADGGVQDMLQAGLARVGQAVSDGRFTGAARIFSELVANDDELSALADSDYLEEAGRYMPPFLGELERDAQSVSPGATDPSSLENVAVPTLVMHGERSALRDWFGAGVRHVTDHVPDHRVRSIDGAGHFGVAFEAEAIAQELLHFLREVEDP